MPKPVLNHQTVAPCCAERDAVGIWMLQCSTARALRGQPRHKARLRLLVRTRGMVKGSE